MAGALGGGERVTARATRRRLGPSASCACWCGAAERPVASGPMGMSGAVWHSAIAESPGWGVAVSETDAHAWLIRWDRDRYQYERNPPEYEEEYFEGDKLSAGGYGDYTAQSGWRLEKAARQVTQMRSLTGLTQGRVLDIGSGYGFFRVALRDAGYEQEGLEVSAFARAVAESYGIDTHPGILDDHWSNWRGRFDAATMFDLIEHVEDPTRCSPRPRQSSRREGVSASRRPTSTALRPNSSARGTTRSSGSIWASSRRGRSPRSPHVTALSPSVSALFPTCSPGSSVATRPSTGLVTCGAQTSTPGIARSAENRPRRSRPQSRRGTLPPILG